MRIGYARVSSVEQSLDRQLDALKGAGAEKIFTEKASGKDTGGRPVLKEMMTFVREGDTLIILSYDRLARSTRDLLDIVDFLRSKGAAFVSLREGIDTSGPTGRLFLTMFGALAQFEREVISERQREGIDAARRRGKRFGRPAAQFPEGWASVFSAWSAGTISSSAAQRKLGLSKTTFYKLVARHKKGAR